MSLPDSIRMDLDQLKKDSEMGASELVSRAIDIIRHFALESNSNLIREHLNKLFREIIYSRPSMAPLINTIGFLLNNLKDSTKESLIRVINEFVEYESYKLLKIKQNFVNFITEMNISNPKIMLISYSSTINKVLLSQKTRNFILYVLESRPLKEGVRTAEILGKTFKTHLIIDAAMGRYIDKIDLVLIGVDSVLKNGSIINKIGTYPLSVLAKCNSKPVNALCDSFKYNLRSYFNLPIEISEKPDIEVLHKVNAEFAIENYYFDLTPAKYIEGFISDLGLLNVEDFLKNAEKILPIDWFKNFI